MSRELCTPLSVHDIISYDGGFQPDVGEVSRLHKDYWGHVSGSNGRSEAPQSSIGKHSTSRLHIMQRTVVGTSTLRLLEPFFFCRKRTYKSSNHRALLATTFFHIKLRNTDLSSSTSNEQHDVRRLFVAIPTHNAEEDTNNSSLCCLIPHASLKSYRDPQSIPSHVHRDSSRQDRAGRDSAGIQTCLGSL